MREQIRKRLKALGYLLGGPRLIQYLRLGSFRNHTLDSIRDAIFHAWPGEIRQLKALVARNVAFIGAVLEVTGKAVPHHIVGNPMRLKARSEIRLDERWKSLLTKAQLKEIDRVAGNLSRRYGYC